jgi:C-terminal processing protease CtpA/Prc
MTNTQPDTTALNRWRIARRVTLSAIVLAGTMATAASLAHHFADAPPCAMHKQADVSSYYTYPGIGVELAREGDDFVVRQVFDGTPADGKLFPGATLVSVDGTTPQTMQGWTSEIRGPKGTAVELEVAYPCSGHDTVTLERDIIRLEY